MSDCQVKLVGGLLFLPTSIYFLAVCFLKEWTPMLPVMALLFLIGVLMCLLPEAFSSEKGGER